MKTVAVKLYAEDVEKIKGMGIPAEVIHKMLESPTVTTSENGNRAVTVGNCANRTVTGGNSDIEKRISKAMEKEHERIKNHMAHILEQVTRNSPLLYSSLPEGTKDWLVPATDKDMMAVARDMQKREAEWQS